MLRDMGLLLRLAKKAEWNNAIVKSIWLSLLNLGR